MVYGCLLLLHLAVGGEQPDPKAVAYGGVILVMLCLTVGPMVGPIKHGKSICHPLQRMKGGLALKMEGVIIHGYHQFRPIQEHMFAVELPCPNFGTNQLLG